MYKEASDTAILALSKDKKNSKAIYLILIMNIEITKQEYATLNLTPFRNIEDYAAKLSDLNKYLGYMGWAEVYINTPNKIEDGRNVL